MLGFKTKSSADAVAGDVLVDNTCMSAWGCTPRLILKVLAPSPCRSVYGRAKPDVLVPNFRVRSYHNTGRTSEYTMQGTANIRLVQATLDQYLWVRAQRYISQPRWDAQAWACFRQAQDAGSSNRAARTVADADMRLRRGR